MKRTVKLFLIAFSSVLLLAGCSLPGLSSNSDDSTISITGGITSEAQILASLVAGMIEHYTDEKTTIINNLATTTINHQAMMNGDAQISAARYTGTDLTTTLNMEPIKDPKKAFKAVQTEFEKRFQQQWFNSYGFANTYAFMVTQETAKKYNLKTISDLKKVGDQLTAGVDTSWIDRKGDGYKGFTETYGFDFKRVFPMQIGLVYDAVAAGKMDVVLGYSTDGRIGSYDLVILEDDLHFFPPYDACTVATDAVLKKYPELKGVLSKLDGKISTETMQKLNYQADNDLMEPETVAENFLKEHHFFENEGGGK
ncbi:osmoprotectant ABC transporter substrate-binding protein [Candidatus Enterococcus mansonii]|uniref:Glycine betaine/carnitine/choline ABC transporter glycine betaine/carnitine/choline-binding protein n=1 Tax=Candidatus Enterococcus mansonii TaxID=1834181 RepID=A0A242CGS3_9ENTE|nr:osmoprotectant ABC transporter substrate-binding protein [Enterococcus sp. 4G2_DIV0659]OTO09443.1 glycine betaine/carnitine/choline ABC transporter glycine betaine/carnitine/choline-binding protein [Enterococcus sp. 4G2_DIV0659]